ncbi:unnamed protein product [Meloidogyne enterolobii]|uniref:Uncharacterized protein n=2 Tax=Meloidogyne enterolobii TaxID=390850 RepID=A0ACB0XWI5_MELEN
MPLIDMDLAAWVLVVLCSILFLDHGNPRISRNIFQNRHALCDRFCCYHERCKFHHIFHIV